MSEWALSSPCNSLFSGADRERLIGKAAAGGFVKKNNHFQIKEPCYLDSEQMAGAKGPPSLPLVTERSKLRQLWLNTNLTFVSLRPSDILCLPRTLSAHPARGHLQPTVCIPRQHSLHVSRSSAKARRCTHRGLLLPSTESKAGSRGDGRDGGEQVGTRGSRQGPWDQAGMVGPSRDCGDQHGWVEHPSTWGLTGCGNEEQNELCPMVESRGCGSRRWGCSPKPMPSSPESWLEHPSISGHRPPGAAGTVWWSRAALSALTVCVFLRSWWQISQAPAAGRDG